MTSDDVVQLGLLLVSAGSILCVARTDRWHRWGYVLGLASEPMWIYSSWVAGQWGIFILSLWWGYYWGVGAYRRFSTPH